MTPRTIAAVLGAIALLIIITILAYNFDPFGRRKNAETKAANATAQVTSDQATIKAVDHYSHETVIVRERADRAVQSVQAAPGAGDPVPPEVLTAWRKGLGAP